MAEHDQLRTGAGDPIKLNELWDALAIDLNAYGAGPSKTVADWRNSLRSWMNQTRSKARSIKEHGSGTGGGPASTKTLTDVEERALSLWGREAVDGLHVGSIGFELAEPSNNVLAESPTTSQQGLTTPPTTQRRKQQPPPTTSRGQSQKTQQMRMLLESDTQIATAINRLADSIADVAGQLAKSNDLLLEMAKTQQLMMSMLLEKL